MRWRRELESMAEALRFLATTAPSQAEAGLIIPTNDESLSHFDRARAVHFARMIYVSRRNRKRHFPNDLFGEPAWDILLDILVHTHGGKRSTVTDVTNGSCVPEATAMRWIDRLESVGLIVRTRDATDARRRLVDLTPSGESRLLKQLTETLALMEATNARVRFNVELPR